MVSRMYWLSRWRSQTNRELARLITILPSVCDSLGKDASFEQDAYSEEVETKSLDNVLKCASVGRVDVIKLDVQELKS